ncbi:MAG: hydrogenase iron-sulfur subunit [Verrucomicrobia bacterium]|nr:hydrogenase iron-sulfur subunit [Verrucomicrobiota bacterium]MCF7708610.1 hydrogenase iron-sulfur subunit [Verrucomicrobiota bacterium]
MSSEAFIPKILVPATVSCAYPGADAVGKAHLKYPTNIDIIRVPSPVMFPEDFYLGCFMKGIDGILIAGCGSDCPFEGAYTKLTKRIDGLVKKMRAGGLEIERLRLTAICTVCVKAFLKEVNQLNDKVKALGPVNRDVARVLWEASLREIREGIETETANE